MENLEFQVSAKTARLIGRENISDVDGAIIELVKNGYDADADCVYIKYFNPYDKIPLELSFSEVKKFFEDNLNIINRCYEISSEKYTLKSSMINDKELLLLFKSLSKIIVIDNGTGMSLDTIKNSWMNIGTDDKEVNIYSKKKKRIKTGAKGIGRFALDKLSLKSRVITKSTDDKLVQWEIDWSQFDDVKLLNQVKAKILLLESSFEDIVKKIAKNDFDLLNDYDWTTGTIIELSPIRDFWYDKLYIRTNDNLKNINPFGSTDKFDIIVKNNSFPDLDYISISEGINRDMYDLSLKAEFDGNNTVNIIIDRNEINIDINQIVIPYSDNDKEIYDLTEFWNSNVFDKDKYRRENYNGEVKFFYTLKEILPKDTKDYEVYKEIGPFSIQIYYLKNTKSTVEIIKDCKINKRKKLLDNFSGIKIYRDNFKVRPYGDKGQFYDWIDLSQRVQKSPAAASHPTGQWRVSPNQVIGSVSISRIANQKLYDNSNREGMSLNSEYYKFIKIIDGIFSKFEYDRQYPLREYAIWKNSKMKKHDDAAQEIYEKVKSNREKNNKNKSDENDNNNYNEEDLKDAVYFLGKAKEKELTTNQLLMILSSAGVMAQTFSHEISRIATNLGSRGQHMRASIDLILDYKPFDGDNDFNPYDLVKELDDTDLLLSEWVNLIMDSVKKENFYLKEIDLLSFLSETRDKWNPLLSRKYIEIEDIEYTGEISITLPLVDLHLLINNFLLNSAYFLEETKGVRKISFKLYEDANNVYLEMINNGPKLDEKYRQNPDEILNAQETSKPNGYGTGLGLWIAKEAVIRNEGKLNVIPIDSGFKLQAVFKR